MPSAGEGRTGVVSASAARTHGGRADAASAIRRGAERLLRARGLAAVGEVNLGGGRRADIAAVSRRGEIWIIEIKSCAADFRSDGKWPAYRAWCDRLYFAVPVDFAQELLPGDVGVILADRYGGEIRREAPHHALPPARRKGMTLRILRTAAARLWLASDPLDRA